MDVFVDPDRAYSMTLPNMGHAVLINNIAGEQPGSIVDVQCMKDTLETIGFTVHVHENCTDQQMRKHKKWMLREDSHEDSNCFVLVILCHGNDKGHLLDRNRKKAWDTEDLVGDLSEVETLRGKPKVMVIQACRGTQWSDGRPVPVGTLADDDEVASTHILPDKADMFLAYATVPGYRAFAGGDTGSIYLQTFAKYLKQFYMRLPLDRIYLLVKQSMVQSVQGEQGMRQASEERNSLTYLLRFADFHKKNEAAEPPETTDPPTTAKPKSANEEAQSDEEFQDATDTMEEKKKETISEEKVTADVAPVTTKAKEETKNVSAETPNKSPPQAETAEKTPTVKEAVTPESETKTKTITDEGDKIADDSATTTETTPMAIPIAEALDIANRMSVRGFSAKPQISIKIVGKGDSVEADEPVGDGKAEAPKEETKDPEEMKETPAKEANAQAAGAEGAASLVEVENVVQKVYLGTGQSVDEDETSARITLRHQSTSDPELIEWAGTKMTVMPSSGDLVVWGQAKKKLGSSKVAFHIIRCTNGKWKKKSSFSGLCEHSTEVNISPATIQGEEMLAVSCFSCRNIKFYDIEKGEIKLVYSSPIYVPYGFCAGEPDFVFVFAQNEEMNKSQILKLHYESDGFTVCQSFDPDLNLEGRGQELLLGTALMKMVDLSTHSACPCSLHFVPNHNLLLLSSSQKGIIQALDCSKEVVAWRHALKPEAEAEVNRGAFYFPESDTILVADGSDHKILVLNPNDGSYMHSIALFDNVGSLSEIALRGDTIILLHSVKHKEKISFYTISGERSDDDDMETKRRITKRRITSRRTGGGSKKI